MVLREPSDTAVSPVVGMILVLAISIVGIAAILYWGLPAIDEMKANVEHKSVEAQFRELDASIKELVAGTTEKTAKRWQPTLNRGSVVMANETEGWIYATEMWHGTKNHSFAYAGFDNGDHKIAMTNYGENTAPNKATIQAYRLNGTTSGEELKVKFAAGGLAQSFTWDAGTTKDLELYDASDKAVNARNATIRFRVYDDSTKIAEAFFIPTGRVDYELNAGLGTKTVTENNGAVITGNGVSATILNQPPLPPVANTTGTSRFFARAVVLNATGSFAGDDRFDVLVTLYSTATLASYDCSQASSLTNKGDCVETTKIFVFGPQKDVWYSYLQNSGRGYDFDLKTQNNVQFLEHREGWMGYTLLQSTVQLTTG